MAAILASFARLFVHAGAIDGGDADPILLQDLGEDDPMATKAEGSRVPANRWWKLIVWFEPLKGLSTCFDV